MFFLSSMQLTSANFFSLNVNWRTRCSLIMIFLNEFNFTVSHHFLFKAKHLTTGLWRFLFMHNKIYNLSSIAFFHQGILIYVKCSMQMHWFKNIQFFVKILGLFFRRNSTSGGSVVNRLNDGYRSCNLFCVYSELYIAFFMIT